MEPVILDAQAWTSELSVFSLGTGIAIFAISKWLSTSAQGVVRTSHVLTLVGLVASCFLALLFLFKAQKVLLVFGIAAAVAVGFFSASAFVAFYIGLLLLRPWEVFPAEAYLLLIPKSGAALVLSFWVFESFRRKKFSIVLSDILLVFITFAAWIFIANLGSGNSGLGTDFYIQKFVPIIALSFVMSQSARDHYSTRIIQFSYVLSTIGVCIGAFFHTFGREEIDPVTRLNGFGLLGNSNDLAALALPALAILLFARSSKLRYLKLYLLPLSMFLFAAIYYTQSRAALLAIALAVVFSKIAQRGLRVRTLVLSAFVLIGLLVATSLLGRDEGDMEMSSSSRLNYAIAGMRMAIHHPIFGIGLNRYPDLYEQYTPAFYEWGQRTAHSSWVLTLSESGPLGLGILFSFFALVLLRAYRCRERYPELLPAVLCYLVAMSFLSHTYFFLPYVLAFIVSSASSQFLKLEQDDEELEESKLRTRRAKGARAFASFALVASLLVYIPKNAQAEWQVRSSPDFRPQEVAQLAQRRGEALKLILAKGEKGLLFLLHDFRSCERFSVRAPKGIEVSAFEMRSIIAKKPSFTGAKLGAHYDPLVPFDFSRRCLGGSGAGAVLLEFSVARSTPSAQYGIEFVGASRTQRIEVQVLDRVMPAEPVLPFYTDFSTWYNLLGHYGEWRGGEGELAKKYIDLLLEHRFLPITPHVAGPKVPETVGMPLNLDHPPGLDSFRNVNLAWRPAWGRIGIPTISRDKVQSEFALNYLRALNSSKASFSKEQWERLFFYLWDEPGQEEMPQVRLLASLVRKLAPEIEIMLTTGYDPSLMKLVDIFCPVMDFYEHPSFPKPAKYQEIQRQGKEVWWYVSCMSHGCESLANSGTPDLVIEREAAHPRVIAWLSWKYKLDAFLYYFVNFAYQFYPKRDPWKDIWDFSGNGDGTLVYPMRVRDGFPEEAPASSLRLKLLRQGSYDLHYLEWAKEAGTLEMKDLNAIVKTTRKWSRSYADFQRLRDNLALSL